MSYPQVLQKGLGVCLPLILGVTGFILGQDQNLLEIHPPQ